MDVRCDRCQTEYELDDESVTDAGASVQCTTCGHTFTVSRSGVVRSATPSFGRGSVDLSGLRTAVDPSPTPAEWLLQTEDGQFHRFRDLTTLQKWIVERRVTRADRISRDGTHWRSLNELPEVAPFFAVVEQADRAQALEHSGRRDGGELDGFVPEERPRRGGSRRGGGAALVQSELPDIAADSDFVRVPTRASAGVARWILLLVVIGGLAAGGYAAYRHYVIAPHDRAPGTAVDGGSAATNGLEGASDGGSAGAALGEPSLARDAGAERSGILGAPGTATAPPDAGSPAGAGLPTGAGLPPTGAAAPAPSAPSSASAAKTSGTGSRGSYESLVSEGDRLLLNGQTGRAQRSYEEALAIRSNGVAALTGSGYVLLDRQRPMAAISMFKRALAGAAYPPAMFGLAEAHRAQGDGSAALENYRRYLVAEPQGADAVAARRQVRELEAALARQSERAPRNDPAPAASSSAPVPPPSSDPPAP